MGRTLYLFENDGITATLDGPSLWIERPLKAGQRIPLRLISRVFLVGEIKISSAAILALAEHNIPLVLAAKSGKDKTALLPFNHMLPKYYKEQRVILENNNNLKRYMDWVETYRNYLQLKLIKKYMPYERIKNEIGEGDYKILLRKLMPKDLAFWFPVKNTVSYLLRGLIIENIIKAKLDLHVGGYFRRANFGFVWDMNYILEARADEQAIMFFKQKDFLSFFQKQGRQVELTKDGHKNIVHRFENKRDSLEGQINKIIDDFFNLVRELQT
jgi:hypothetical protein